MKEQRIAIQGVLFALVGLCLATNHWNAAAGMTIALTLTIKESSR